MNPLSKNLQERVQELFIKNSWQTGLSITEFLIPMSWEKANEAHAHPFKNSIFHLTFHLHYYLQGINHALLNYTLTISDRFSFPAHEGNAEEWANLKTQLELEANTLMEYLEYVSDHELQKPFADGRYGSILRNIDGMLQHSSYHFGQMVLISKFIS